MSRRARERVNGPYAHRRQWKLVHAVPGATPRPLYFASREAALAAKRALLREIALTGGGGATIGDAIEEFLRDGRTRWRNPNTARTYRIVLEGLLASVIDEAPESITVAKAARIWERWRRTPKSGSTDPKSVATLHDARLRVRALWGYLIDSPGSAVRACPWQRIRIRGRARRGKLQLTADEGALFVRLAAARAWDGDSVAAAALLQIYCALRPREARAVIATKSLDRGNTAVRVLGKNGTWRTVPISRTMLWLLDRVALGYRSISPSWHRQKLAALCRAAGVTEVSPQSLRGAAASWARQGGAESELVARFLDHSHARITERHYYAPGVSDEIEAKSRERDLGNAIGADLFPTEVRAVNDAILQEKSGRSVH